MGQVEIIISKENVVSAAHRDNLVTLAKLIPYLMERKEYADRYIQGSYNKEGSDLLFQHIEFCNKKIALILGIAIDNR